MSQPAKMIVAVPSSRTAALPSGVVPAHMAYRMDTVPHLMRSTAPSGRRGGLMYLPGCQGAVGENRSMFLQQMLRECTLRGFTGVVADFDPQADRSLYSLARDMDGALRGKGLLLYLPEPFASAAPNARVLVSSAISGGSLEARLEDARKAYGAERVVLALEKIAEDFTPPVRTGRGRPLSREALTALRTRLRPNIFWSGALCARYFTYFESSGRTHFVLFDDQQSLKAKVRLAGDLGIEQVLAAYDDLGSDWFA